LESRSARWSRWSERLSQPPDKDGETGKEKRGDDGEEKARLGGGDDEENMFAFMRHAVRLPNAHGDDIFAVLGKIIIEGERRDAMRPIGF
jgi:hypothetical protein